MSHHPVYGYPTSVGSDVNMAYTSPQPSRRTVDSAKYGTYPASTVPTHMDPRLQPACRPMTSSTSSLAGAMGDSPSPEVSWSPSPEHRPDAYGCGQPGSITYNPSITNNYLNYQDVMSSNVMISTPEATSPTSPNFPQRHQYAYRNQHVAPTIQPVPEIAVKAEPSTSRLVHSSAASNRGMSPESDTSALHKRIRELELVNESSRLRIQQLEQELARSTGTFDAPNHHPTASGLTGLPSPAQSPLSSSSLQASWAARTDARIKQFCSLNRAGNALCSWHETRRERRAHPPRAAPPGYMNCGCTYEETLFEESLARHGVGSYYPGESVRMDPALRNPLLRLLKQRYGYKDGDFELDPVTGNWQEGEGPLFWEQRALSGASTKRSRTSD